MKRIKAIIDLLLLGAMWILCGGILVYSYSNNLKGKIIATILFVTIVFVFVLISYRKIEGQNIELSYKNKAICFICISLLFIALFFATLISYKGRYIPILVSCFVFACASLGYSYYCYKKM